MSNDQLQQSRPFVARTIRRFSPLIILAWLAIIGVLNFCVPSLEAVEHEHAVTLSPSDAPSVTASQRLDEDFKVANQAGGGSLATIVLEGQQPLATTPTNITTF